MSQVVETLTNLVGVTITEPEIAREDFTHGSATLYSNFIVYEADFARVDRILRCVKLVKIRMARYFPTTAEASAEFSRLVDNVDFLIWAEMPNGRILGRQCYSRQRGGSAYVTLIQHANGYTVTDTFFEDGDYAIPDTRIFEFADEPSAREHVQEICSRTGYEWDE